MQDGQQWNEILFYDFPEEFLPNLKGFFRVFLTMFWKNMIITYRSSACTHPPFVLLEALNPLLEKEADTTRQMIHCFFPQ